MRKRVPCMMRPCHGRCICCAGMDRAGACSALRSCAPSGSNVGGRASTECYVAMQWCRGSVCPLFRAQDPIYLRIFKVLFFVIQPQITGPLYVRLAFHDAATWNKNATNKGGCVPRRSSLPIHLYADACEVASTAERKVSEQKT